MTSIRDSGFDINAFDNKLIVVGPLIGTVAGMAWRTLRHYHNAEIINCELNVNIVKFKSDV